MNEEEPAFPRERERERERERDSSFLALVNGCYVILLRIIIRHLSRYTGKA